MGVVVANRRAAAGKRRRQMATMSMAELAERPVISFHFNPETFTQASAHVISGCQGSITRMKLFKLLYLADRAHLIKYARPILKDRYVNMDQGPVPSASYDLVKKNLRTWSQGAIDEFSKYIQVSDIHVSVIESPGTDMLSQSDIAELDIVVARYGKSTAGFLSALTHRHKAWQASQRNRPIDYALFFDNPEVEGIQDLVEYDQPIRNISKNASIHQPNP
jgi:uncharacterized phage-associated protein